jgi:hypothetical protein
MAFRPRRLRALGMVGIVALSGALVAGCSPAPQAVNNLGFSSSLHGRGAGHGPTKRPRPTKQATPTTTKPRTSTSTGGTGTTTTPAAPTSAPLTPTPAPMSAPASVPTSAQVTPPAAGQGSCPDFPTPACTGVPTGTKLTTHSGDLTVSTAGQTIEGLHVTGQLNIRANNVTIRNSQVDGIVTNAAFNNEPSYPFTISDSTIGAASGCDSAASALGEGNFTASRVLIRGFGDGIRASAPNITIQNSYIKLCSTISESHSDGIQDYVQTANLVFTHNTVDQCGPVPTNGKCNFGGGFTSPIFIDSNTNGGTEGAQITNNLVMGGVYSIYLHPQTGRPWTVTGNRIVDKTWAYAPAETNGLCSRVKTWSDNAVVTINSDYQVTSTVSTVPCPN